MRRRPFARTALHALRASAACAPLACAAHRPAALAPREGELASRIRAITERPEFKHATFGVEVYSLDTDGPVYQLNADKLLVPGSTAKLFTAGTALAVLGADFRFQTKVYRTGAIAPDGTLDGDLVLVASGDPNLSGRITPANTLAFADHDHSYAGAIDSATARNGPLFVIQKLADQVAARGVRRVRGRVLVDASLFAEGERELGTGVVISPVMVNDNVVDVTVTPGAAPGVPAVLAVSPASSYVRFVNRVTTGARGSESDVTWSSDTAGADGSRTVTASGSMAVGDPPALIPYAVPSPSKFAAATLADALRRRGIAVDAGGAVGAALAAAPDFRSLSTSYTPANVVAEHASPPLSEEVKVMLKVSQNLHASAMPFILAAVHEHADSSLTGFDLERDVLVKAGLDLGGAVQGDGAGGLALYTPGFVARYLAHMAQRPDSAAFARALPVLGRDGTLVDIQVRSPAAGHVRAKTGTYAIYDPLNRRTVVTGKGLAGYVTNAAGRRYAFAIYANNVAVKNGEAAQTVVGEALGEIASAIYTSTTGSGR